MAVLKIKRLLWNQLVAYFINANWVVLLCCALLSVEVQAEEKVDVDDLTHYLLLGSPERPIDHAPYTWMTNDRVALWKGITDDQGHAYIKQASGVSQYYLVLWNGTQFPITVKQSCWELPQQKFDQCVERYKAESSPERIAEEKERKAQEEKKYAKRLQRATWVFDEIEPTEVRPMIDDFIKTHQRWLNSNKSKIDAQIAAKAFECKHLSAEVVKRMRILGPNKTGRLDSSDDQVIAAKNGNWVAASNMATKMIYYDEDWSSASAIIAWMIKQGVPSAYDRLADLISATSSYEHGSSSSEAKDLIAGLRWHSAMLGSYVGQENLADLFRQQGHEALADSAMACATKQRANYGR